MSELKIIDTHAHLGDIYGFDPHFQLESHAPENIYPNKMNTYERMKYRNIYFGRLNYLFKPLIAGAARQMTRYATAPNLLNSMKKNNINKAVVLALEPNVTSESILSIAQKNPNLVPFCSIHPYDKEKKEKLRRYVETGAKGLKLHPVIQRVAPDDPAVFEILEEIRLLKVPVLFHAGWGSIGKGSYGFINHYKELLETFRDVIIILAHIGFYEPCPFIDLIAKYDNVYCDTSWQPEGIIKKAIDRLGSDRLLFGSDWPYNLQQTSLNIILRLTKNKPELRKKILYNNAAQLINFA